MSLTPLYKTITNNKTYYTSIHMGINLPETIRYFKSDKKK